MDFFSYFSKKNWVDRAMVNETIYRDGLIEIKTKNNHNSKKKEKITLSQEGREFLLLRNGYGRLPSLLKGIGGVNIKSIFI